MRKRSTYFLGLKRMYLQKYCAERIQTGGIWKVAFEPGTQKGMNIPISVPALSALTDIAFIMMLNEAEESLHYSAN